LFVTLIEAVMPFISIDKTGEDGMRYAFVESDATSFRPFSGAGDSSTPLDRMIDWLFSQAHTITSGLEVF